MLINFLIILFFLFNLLIFICAIKKSKNDQFYTDTKSLIPIGIFVWGDALILAPFWMIISVIFLFISPLNMLRFLLIFHIVRSFFEVIYWLNHQAVKSKYQAPMFRKYKWINPDQSAILYQLINTCQVILEIFILILTFIK